jgi:hypothetical protein
LQPLLFLLLLHLVTWSPQVPWPELPQVPPAESFVGHTGVPFGPSVGLHVVPLGQQMALAKEPLLQYVWPVVHDDLPTAAALDARSVGAVHAAAATAEPRTITCRRVRPVRPLWDADAGAR